MFSNSLNPNLTLRVKSVFFKKIRKFITETDAATSVEYAVMLMMIIGTCIGAIEVFGGDSGVLWGSNLSGVEQAVSGGN